MLITYVCGMILVLELGVRDLLDAATVQAIQTTLDVPTFLAMVVFVGLSARLELFKPKYKLPVKKRPLYDGMFLIAGLIVTISMLFLKYG